jgi:hypothetical protein
MNVDETIAADDIYMSDGGVGTAASGEIYMSVDAPSAGLDAVVAHYTETLTGETVSVGGLLTGRHRMGARGAAVDVALIRALLGLGMGYGKWRERILFVHV